MREPATSCTDCSRVLLPAEVLYTAAAAIVCEGCLDATIAVPRPRSARIRTRAERRRSLRRWSWLFAGLTLTAAYAGQFSRAQLRAARAMATIDFPRARAAIPRHAVVRGHVAADAITRPLWLVARSAASATGPSCVAQMRAPVVADRTGIFTVAVDLRDLGAGDVHLSVVSVDESSSEAFDSAPAFLSHGFSATHVAGDCSGELPRGTLVLTSVDVTLSET